MGTIQEKLEYLVETRKEIRDGINKLGGGLTLENTFRSYADALDDIYDSMPKVEENDVTSATLDGTIKGGLDISLKGNTSQDTTTGENLYNVYDTLSFGDIVSVDSDGWITITYDNTSGSSTKWFDFKTKVSNLVSTSTNYKLVVEIQSVSGTGNIRFTHIQNISQMDTELSYNFDNLSSGTRVYSVTTVSDFTSCTSLLNSYGSFTAGQKGSIKFRMTLQSENTTPQTFVYQKFTGGIPAPNPSYPQPIHSVSGDNKIEVGGGINLEVGSIDATTGTEVVENYARRTGYMYFGTASKVYLKRSGSTTNMKARWYSEDKTYIGSSPAISGTTSIALTLNPPIFMRC